MIRGFDIFKKWFTGYDNQYVIIGGTACDILMDEYEQAFRATKDIDIILIAETLTSDFGQRFWDFVKTGDYRNKKKSNGEPQFYRFTNPSKSGFPIMIELFSKKIDLISLPDDAVLTPMPLDDDLSSLSAILVDDEYYNLMRKGKTVIDGIPLLDTAYLIAFKVKAWLDLSVRKKAGEVIDSKHIRKHKNDIFRLSVLLTAGLKIDITDTIKADLDEFFAAMKDEDIDLRSLGVGGDKKDVLKKIMRVYY
ncbi:MAG: hypothetical protein FWE14_09460 [Lachnospiraceae bacterium]|nr:hypothetical protein [Lachnospiraceae bacterium]